MRRGFFRIILLSVLLCFTVSIFISAVNAEPSLKWSSTNVYYDSQGRLVIEGYFSNNGTRIVTKVNWLDLKIYFKRWYTKWWLQTESVFKDIDLNLFPGETSGWTLRIIDTDYTQFDYCDVVYDIDYNYI